MTALLRQVAGAAVLAELADSAAAIEPAIRERPLEDLPELEAWLARVGGLIRVRFAREPHPAPPALEEDRLLTIGEAARRLEVKKAWLYQNHRSLPFTVRLGAQHLRFSASGLRTGSARKRLDRQ